MKLNKKLSLTVFFILLFAIVNANQNSSVEKSVTDFLAWYKKNQQRLNSINLVLNYNQGESSKPYTIDYKATEKYLTELKKSGLIGAKYVENQREYFKKCEIKFNEIQQKSGPPQGFEYDLVLHTQDTETLLSNLEKVKIISSNIKSNSYSLVVIKFQNDFSLKFELSKQDNKWLIQSIYL